MKSQLVIGILFLSVPALAQNAPSILQKACIVAAAEKLPKVPGIEILGTRIRTFKTIYGSSENETIDIDIKAAGLTVTYSFGCTKGPGGIVVLPMGVTK